MIMNDTVTLFKFLSKMEGMSGSIAARLLFSFPDSVLAVVAICSS